MRTYIITRAIHTQAPDATLPQVAASLDKYCYPDGRKNRPEDGGRRWATWEQAEADIKAAMKQQGLSHVLVDKHSFWDVPARTSLKKVVIKCPHAGKHRGQSLEVVKAEGGRKTTTIKHECPVQINIKVERTGASAAYMVYIVLQPECLHCL